MSARLATQAKAICEKLLPGGREHSGEWLCGDISGKSGDSLKVRLCGTYAGQWKDWSNDSDHGDLIDLWAAVRGIPLPEALREAKEFLGITDPVRMAPVSYAKPEQRETIKPISPEGRAMEYLTKARGLAPATIAAFKIDTDSERRAIVFPSYAPSGELQNRSYRTLEAKKRVWQDKGCAPSLFGWQAITEAAYRSRTILLAEGQLDAATWHQWGIPALSIPNGSGKTWIDYEWDNLAAFDTIYIAFDQDAAGQKIAEEVVERLGKHRCLLVAMPKKDANDCLSAGYTAKDAADWIAGASPPRINKLITASELHGRLMAEIAEKPEPFTMSFMGIEWPDRGFWFRPAEVTLWGGYSHAGKSTMLNFLISNLLVDQYKIFTANFESKVETMMRKLGTIFYGPLDGEKVDHFLDGCGHHLAFADIVGSIGQDELMEMMWFAFRRYGCTHFIIDSLMRIRGLEEDYPAQGEFCNRLQDFAKQSGAHVHLVAHLAKPNGTAERPSMYAIKGSSLLVNNADNVLLMSRNPHKEKIRKTRHLTTQEETGMHDAEIIVEKQRETGWLGLFKLAFNPKRQMFSAFHEPTLEKSQNRP